MEICEEISLSSFVKKMLRTAFLLRFKANNLEKKAWLRQFFSVDSNSTYKDFLHSRCPNLVQNN